jgi:mRNA interferase RelE/StbE
MTNPEPFELVVSPPAARAIRDRLPEPVAVAVIEFMTSALLTNPYRVGKPLVDSLAGIWSARRGTYRILYRVNEQKQEVLVLRVEHRRDDYRPL